MESPSSHLPTASHRLLAMALAAALALFGVVAVGAVAHGAIHPAAIPVLKPGPADGSLYPDQPRNGGAFEAICLAAPFLGLGAWALSRLLTRRLDPARVRFFLGVVLVAEWIGFGWALSPVISYPNPPSPLYPPSWVAKGPILKDLMPHLHGAVTLVLLALVVAGAVFLGRGWWRRGRTVAGFLLLAAWVLLIPIRFYTPFQIDDEARIINHFNAVAWAVAQVADGRHLLVDFGDQYGGYAEFLGTFLKAFPHHLKTFLALFARLNAAAVLCLLLVLWRTLRHPGILLAAGLSLLTVEYLNCDFYLGDHYYNYEVVRKFFPSLGLLAGTLYLLRPGCGRWLLASLVAGVAPVWNLDTGLVLWLAWTLILGCREVARRDWLGAFRAVLVQVAFQTGAWAVFALWLRVSSGQWGDWSRLIAFQRLFFTGGFLGMPMLVPDAWMIPAMVYFLGLLFPVIAMARGRFNRRDQATLFLALLGIGLFSYFIGRAAATNLLLVSYPAILLLAVLLDRAVGLIRRRFLPRLATAFLVPALLLFGWWTVNGLLAIPRLAQRSGENIAGWHRPVTRTFAADTAFVTSLTSPGEKVLILSLHGALFYYLSNTVDPLATPGTGELLFWSDVDAIAAALREGRIAKVFVDPTFLGPTPYRIYVQGFYDELGAALAGRYRVAASSMGGELSLMVPR